MKLADQKAAIRIFSLAIREANYGEGIFIKRHPKGKAFHPQLAEAFGLGNPDESIEMTPNLTPEEAAAKRKPT